MEGELENMGFEMNDYNECTFNKIIEGTQFTVPFHVDHLKLSHLSQGVVAEIIDALNSIFGTTRKYLQATALYTST